MAYPWRSSTVGAGVIRHSPQVALSFVLCVGFMALALPETARAQALASESRFGESPQTRPLAQAISREVARLATEDATPPRLGPISKVDLDWLGLRDVEGESILLTLRSGPQRKRYVVRGTVSESGLTVLNLTDPSIPAAVTDALAGAAWWHPEYFSASRKSATFEVTKRMRLSAGDVLVDDRKVAELDHLVEHVGRDDVAEVRWVKRATKRGFAWGAVAGGAVGLGIMMKTCGTHWTRETSSCGNLNELSLLLSSGLGIGLGSGIGASVQISPVVYRAP